MQESSELVDPVRVSRSRKRYATKRELLGEGVQIECYRVKQKLLCCLKGDVI